MRKAKNIQNPFPGLRPFSFKDRKKFFGRKEQVIDVVNRISNQRFIAITGPSGTGKSSLVNAGIIPFISEGFNNVDESTWRIINLMPGTYPMENLAWKISESINNAVAEDKETGQPEKISRLLHSSPDGLAESLKQTTETNYEKVLLIIDQFEDLFRFKRSRGNYSNNHENESFIKLILEAHNQEVLPIHIILVIRSDFTDELRQFHDLNNLIKTSNYILPEMTREDMQKAIWRPAALSGCKIDPGLVQQILNDLRDKPDKLSLLQYTINRLWKKWAGQKNDDRTVFLKDYEAIGGINNALVRDLNKPYEELTGSDRLLCERIFKTITEKGTNNSEISIPVRIADIANITGAGVKKVIRIVDKFRQPDHPFLYPTHDHPVNSATVIELTHESIMRLWPRLQNWMSEEAEAVAIYKRLAEASGLYLLGQEPLLDESGLEQALLWHKKHKPTLEWARRYNPGFERTIEYITLSKEEYEQEEMEKMEELRQPGRAKKYTRIAAAIAVLIIVVSGFFIFDFSELLPEAQDQPELSYMRNVTEIEPLDIPDNQNNEPADPDPVSPEQPADSFAEQRPPERIMSEKQFVSNEGRPNETPVAGNRVPAEPPAAPEEETVPPAIRPDPEELRSREEAMKNRMVLASHTLASISQQIENDTELKALLTVQSYIFNEKHNSASYNPDIYSGLFASIKDLYGDDYNAFNGHTASVNSLVFRPNSNIFYSASSDGTVRQWDLNDESKTPKTLIDGQVLNNELAISPNARWLAVVSDGLGIKVFDTGTGRPDPVMVNSGNNRIMTLDFYPDNQHILFAGADNEIVKYNFNSSLSHIIGKSDSEVLSLAVSPDSETVAAGTRSGQVILFRGDDDHSGQVIHSDQGNEVHAVSFDRNGTRVAAGSMRGEVRILNVSSGNLVATLRGHSARVVDVKFCPLNRFIASASFDGTIQLWNMQNLDVRPVVLSDHNSWVHTIAFNSAGDKMVTGSRQGSRLLVWSTDADDMASMICARLTRNLTTEEWDQYVGEDILYMESCP